MKTRLLALLPSGGKAQEGPRGGASAPGEEPGPHKKKKKRRIQAVAVLAGKSASRPDSNGLLQITLGEILHARPERGLDDGQKELIEDLRSTLQQWHGQVIVPAAHAYAKELIEEDWVVPEVEELERRKLLLRDQDKLDAHLEDVQMWCKEHFRRHFGRKSAKVFTRPKCLVGGCRAVIPSLKIHVQGENLYQTVMRLIDSPALPDADRQSLQGFLEGLKWWA
eukprot:CAMPEP_0119137694 /NCGR_PEP_ID=MMETSP1310-20130426/24132_1 /TAXON_ID=464262 /ORGANISM="Genus nov. species nov., Strain RCC2339" /LENGTH=222 /DNA_ID=CAMNT_0007128805 /DNA_START=9 /DNA_END=677 /DNA_ORIENTATION=+